MIVAVILLLSALAGDLNCDGRVDVYDVNSQAIAILDRDAFLAEFPTGNWWAGDCNCDHRVDQADIAPFIMLIQTGEQRRCPSPLTNVPTCETFAWLWFDELRATDGGVAYVPSPRFAGPDCGLRTADAEPFDLDGDNDVDLYDVAAWQLVGGTALGAAWFRECPGERP